MSKQECEKSPDGKHHYELSSMQHAMMNHTCYSCAFCSNGKCVSNFPDRSDKTLLQLPTESEL